MIEYGLMLALIAIEWIAAVAFVEASVAGLFHRTADSLNDGPTEVECEYGWSWDTEIGECVFWDG